MAQGVPTEEAVVAEFRARYLYSRNASKIGREMNIGERTARRLAEECERDDAFAESVRNIRVRAVDRLVALSMSVAEAAHERYLNDLPMPETVGENASVTIIDRRADDGKLVLEATKNAMNLAKFDADRDGAGKDEPRRLEIILTDREAPEAPPRDAT
jgi:hypothetical protein